MNPRRLIGSLLVLALLAGPTFVPLARAACALPKADTASCPSCAGVPSPAGASFTTDRSCCAAPSSLADRDPATVAADRGADHRALDAAVILPAARALAGAAAGRFASAAADPPGASPPLLRTTILLI